MFSFLKRKPEFQSDINGRIVLDKRYGQRALVTGKITQSGGELVRMWEKVLSQNIDERQPIKTALLLGVGGGMILRLFHRYFPKAKLYGVEMDPVMISIAKEYFDLTESLNETVYEVDALSWVRKEKKQYDLIVVDLFIHEKNAKGTREKGFLLDLRRILRQSGVILYNAEYSAEKTEEHTAFLDLCLTLFEVEEVYAYPLNRVLKLVKK